MKHFLCAVAACAVLAQASAVMAQPAPSASPVAGAAPRAGANPFIPQPKSMSQADIDKAIDERLKKQQGGTAAPGSPLAPGAAAGVAPYGAPGAPGAAGVPGVPGEAAVPLDPVAAALAEGARFVGCVNGKHYFMRKTGGRLIFAAPVLRKAIRERIVPACR